MILFVQGTPCENRADDAGVKGVSVLVFEHVPSD